jgi:hypothetical protein
MQLQSIILLNIRPDAIFKLFLKFKKLSVLSLFFLKSGQNIVFN